MNTSNLLKNILENIKTEEDLASIAENEMISASTADIDLECSIPKIEINNENTINLRK